jgi:hypothetical protein
VVTLKIATDLKPFVVSLSNQERLASWSVAPFDKLRASGLLELVTQRI